MGRPWRFNGQDSVLQTQGAQVSSLVRELRVHVLGSMAKKKKSLSSENRSQPHESRHRLGGEDRPQKNHPAFITLCWALGAQR